jgi:Purine catabolism regulatory protein-like family/PucR C-terminal helix-turn-helix domain
VLLRALAESPELRLRLLTGQESLDRPVAGVFTTDLLDPRRYLSGGEIVLTGLMWHQAPADSEAFVAALAGAGVVALAAGDAALGSVPPDLVEACRHHRLPLFEVPVDVSFGAITEQVMRARLQAGPGRAVAYLRRLAGSQPGEASAGGQARAGTMTADTMGAVFAAAAAEYGVAGWVLSATGRLVAGAPPGPGAGLRSALAAACLAEPDLPAAVSVDGAPFALLPVAGFPRAGHPAHRLARWFVGIAGDQGAWDGEWRAVAAELARLAAVYREQCDDARPAASRAADALLRRVHEWHPGDGQREVREIAVALRRHGVSAGGPVTVAAAVCGAAHAGTGDLPDVARMLLADMLPGAVVGIRGGEALALAAGGPAVAGRVRDAVSLLAQVPGHDLSVGLSVRAAAGEDAARLAGGGSPGQVDGELLAGLSRAAAEASQARRLAALLGAGPPIVDSAQLGSCDFLLAWAPAEARQAYHTRLLAPLLAYDRDHGAELVTTLRVFLGCSGSWTKAAGTMFVHVNSLRYRISRIEDLTGRSLRSLADQAAFLIALRLADSAAEDQRAHPSSSAGVQAGEFPAG